MHVICGYESKEGILGNYILQFATFHLSTQGLHLLENHHFYHYVIDIISFATMADILLLGDFTV